MRNHAFFPSVKSLLGALLLVCCCGVSADDSAQQSGPLSGWGKAGYDSEQYQTGFLEKLPDSGRQLGYIKSLAPDRQGFGTLMRTADIKDLRGKRIQLTSSIKTINADSAAAWFRVNGKSGTLAFDNMSNRRIVGTTDWQRVSLVLDIPDDAETVSYGVMLEGKGKVWFEMPTFRVVDLSVNTTGRSNKPLRPLELEQDAKMADSTQNLQ